MAIITLTSDWGTSDYYVGAVKGVILSLMPEVNIVDISHHINHFDIEEAAFVVRNAYPFFPKGTVHIIGVDTVESTEHPHLLVFHQGHYFIGADNGIFSMIFDSKPDNIFELTVIQDSDFYTFSTRDRFAKTAVKIIQGIDLHELGNPRTDFNSKLLLAPATPGNRINGVVTYVDSYGNAITNISLELFERIRAERDFEINFNTYSLAKLVQTYPDVPEADLLALFGTHGMLEIAINKGDAASLCGLRKHTAVTIVFKE